MAVKRIYPDISDILARKAVGRVSLASRSFVEKIAMIEALWDRLAPIKRAREMRDKGLGLDRVRVEPSGRSHI
jgi:hypothetical protein